jgi:outer membrane murein-binding lipoprotein Lpp
MTDSEQLVEIKALINNLVVDVEGIRSDVEGLKQETAKTNERVEAYQKDSQQSEIKALINHLTEDVESLKQESEVGNFSLLFPMLFLHFTNHKTASSSSPHVSSAHRF